MNSRSCEVISKAPSYCLRKSSMPDQALRGRGEFARLVEQHAVGPHQEDASHCERITRIFQPPESRCARRTPSHALRAEAQSRQHFARAALPARLSRPAILERAPAPRRSASTMASIDVAPSAWRFPGSAIAAFRAWPFRPPAALTGPALIPIHAPPPRDHALSSPTSRRRPGLPRNSRWSSLRHRYQHAAVVGLLVCLAIISGRSVDLPPRRKQFED